MSACGKQQSFREIGRGLVGTVIRMSVAFVAVSLALGTIVSAAWVPGALAQSGRIRPLTNQEQISLLESKIQSAQVRMRDLRYQNELLKYCLKKVPREDWRSCTGGSNEDAGIIVGRQEESIRQLQAFIADLQRQIAQVRDGPPPAAAEPRLPDQGPQRNLMPSLSGRIGSLKGEVEISRDGGRTFRPMKSGEAFRERDIVSTGYESRVTLKFRDDGGELTVGPLSSVRIDEFVNTANRMRTQLYLREGTVRANLPRNASVRGDFHVRTDTVNASIRDSAMMVVYDKNTRRATVYTTQDRSYVRGRHDTTETAIPQGFMVTVGADGSVRRPFAWRWKESEGPWTGIWTRRGDSDVFDATWTNSDGKRARFMRVSATLTIVTRGDAIMITRRQADGTCEYRGTLQGTKASGTYGCTWATGPYEWHAEIR